MDNYSYPDKPLRKKKVEDNERIAWANQHIKEIISLDVVQERTEKALERMRRYIQGDDTAVAWSGGKDSLVVCALAAELGITRGVHGLLNESLEYPAMNAWYASARPPEIEEWRAPYDLEWLAAHPHMAFPTNATVYSQWNQMVQIRAQHIYARKHKPQWLLAGRRIMDGNFCGRDGMQVSRDGLAMFHCIYDWDCETVLGFLAYRGIALPPCYDWPRGFHDGPDGWPKLRRYSQEDGWRLLLEIDPSVLERAAPHFPGAAEVWEASQKDG